LKPNEPTPDFDERKHSSAVADLSISHSAADERRELDAELPSFERTVPRVAFGGSSRREGLTARRRG
jgi:hypothetical protein